MAELPNSIGMGDLVMVVRTCCSARVSPTVFTVGQVWPARSNSIVTICACCGARVPNEIFAGPVFRPGVVAQPVSWLKKLPPLSTLESLDFVAEIESERPRERVNA